MNIVVLAGGLSPERDVSLSSGVMIANALLDRGHRVLLADLFMGIADLPKDPLEAFASNRHYPAYSVPETAPDLDALFRTRKSGLSDSIGNGIVEACRAADVTFLALHGGIGENGSLQSFFDLNDIKYTGSPSFGCALAMNKWVTKQLFNGNGIRTPHGILLHQEDPIPEFSLPCVVKPCCGGSSIGISIPRTRDEFLSAVKDAFRYEPTVLVEEYISGRELTCGILGGQTLPPTEIIPHNGFYDYAHKYQPGWTEEITPASISAEETGQVQEMTRKAFNALNLSVYGRADFILDSQGLLYCIEVNTLPGMTPTSLLPQGAAESGIDYPSLCEKIVSLSLEK